MGKRGEGWVVIQLLLFGLIILIPNNDKFYMTSWLYIGGWILLLLGGIIGTAGLFCLGKNLSPFPKPKESSTFVRNCIYSVIRHPIYSGLIMGTMGFAIIRNHLIGIGLSAVLFVFFDRKANREEKWLVERYKEYEGYRRKVKKIIPFIY